jgi:hypothetical protein
MPPSVAIKDDPQTHHLMQTLKIIPSSEYDDCENNPNTRSKRLKTENQLC